MDLEDMKFVPVSPKERVHFKCIGCGACCRNVYQAVPVETLDAFRIARYLRESGHTVQSMDDFWAKYGEPALLDECGYFVYFLKTTGEDHACVFLEGNRCTIHTVNPRACRTYPFVMDPENHQYLLTHEREHHFKGPSFRVKNWMQRRLNSEDLEFVKLDYESVIPIARLLKAVPEEQKLRASMLFQLYKYSSYDLDKPFIEQFRSNTAQLIRVLGRLAGESGRESYNLNDGEI